MDDFAARWVVPPARPHEGGWWPSPQLVLESPFPGYVNLYTNYGVPLEQIAWRPYALYPGHFAPGPDVSECHFIMSGGNHLRDLDVLRLATDRLPAGVHSVLLYDQGERFEGNAHLLHEGEVSLRSFYHAIAHSRFVVVPLREDVYRAAGVTVIVMALMAGRPVVATSTAATRDYIQDGTEGLLVPPGDANALADAIARLDTDAALLSRLAAGARHASTRVTTEHWADQIVSGQPLHPVWTPRGWRNW
jgi:glycosyltransferase involved in cell wall biosynthesis